MARIRSIKPEFWTDRSLARKLSIPARLFYIGLWNFADEHARINGDPFYLKGQIFPYDDFDDGEIDDLIEELVRAGKAVRYDGDEDPYLFLPTLNKHQRLEPDKVPSRLPAPPDLNEPGPLPPSPAQDNTQVRDSAQIGADSSESRPDESAPGADESALLYVAGSRLLVAGGREHGSPRADVSQPPLLAVIEQPPLTPLAEFTPTFDDFWKPWPRKVDKEPARKAFDKAIKKANAAVIVEACRAYAQRCIDVGQDPQFIPHPATWLNKERWTNDLDAVMPLPAAARGAAEQRLAEGLERDARMRALDEQAAATGQPISPFALLPGRTA